MRQRMDRAEPLLERDRTHGGRRHHVGAGLDIRAVLIGARQIFLDQPEALERDALAHRVVERRRIGFEAMRERIHACARRDHLRHADRQFRIADRDTRQEFRVEDDLLGMRLGIGDDGGAADFRAGAGSCRHRDDRRNAVGVGARPPVADILEIPYRAGLASHESHAFAEIEARAATECDDTVMTAILVGLDPGGEVLVVRVGVDIGEDRPAKTTRFENVECILRDRHRREAAIGDQQRLLHAQRLAMIGEFLDAARAHLDQGGVAPVCGDRHQFDFLR
jgi:hypothetical protein